MKNLRKDNRITFSETRTKVCLLLSFVMPILVLLAIAYYFNIYPFSSDCIATDSLQQTYLFPEDLCRGHSGCRGKKRCTLLR